MPEVTYTTVMNLPVTAIWDFVQDMNNWAPFLTGYVSHEIKTDTHSVWTLKGDVGMLSRTVLLDVHITEWSGPDKVEFTLTGINEAVEGGGTFTMRPRDGAETVGVTDTPAQAPGPSRPGFLRRTVRRLFAWLFRRKFGAVERVALAPAQVEPGASDLAFRLRMDAGGPMAPMINAMLGPMLLPAATDLGDKIAAHLEQMHAVGPPAA